MPWTLASSAYRCDRIGCDRIEIREVSRPAGELRITDPVADLPEGWFIVHSRETDELGVALTHWVFCGISCLSRWILINGGTGRLGSTPERWRKDRAFAEAHKRLSWDSVDVDFPEEETGV